MFVLMWSELQKAIFIFGLYLFSYFASWYHYQEEYLLRYFENDDLVREFDYIVVGAGSAGAIVALRLAQQEGDKTVLLLEAGSYGGPVMNTPLSSSFIQLTELDWQHKTTPQANACEAFNNNQCSFPRGKLIGGSSRLNNMVHVEGHPKDFPYLLSSPNNNKKYNDHIKPYFERIKKYLLDEQHDPYLTELSEALLEAGREVLGVPIRDAKNMVGHSTGFMVPRVNIKHGSRFLSGEYLMKNMPTNLKVSTHSYAEKIFFKPGTELLEANGVVFKRFGEIKKVYASKAVVLSAGTISSPHILMLSGLGPTSHLASHHISTLINLPQVGQNLQDHVSTGFDLFHLERPLSSLTPETVISPWSFLRYNIFGDGPWSFNQCDAIAILHLDCVNEDIDKRDKSEISRRFNETYEECEKRQIGQPDLQFMMIPMGVNSDKGIFIRKIFGFKDEIWENYFSLNPDTPTFVILPIVLHPKSMGHISLVSASPHAPPSINPNYLSHSYDVDTLIRGLQIALRLVEKGTIFREKMGAMVNRLKIPGCTQWEFGSREYFECYVRKVTLTVHHQIGTCRMGRDSKTSVVDNNFLVHRTKNLHVVDASVMPSLPSGNPNAAIVMLAEMASDIIIKRYNEMKIVDEFKTKTKDDLISTKEKEGTKSSQNKYTILNNVENNIRVNNEVQKDEF